MTASTIPTRRLAMLLAGLAMFGPFSIDTIFPAFPQIGAQFGADKLVMQQTISAYLIAYAAMSVVHGPLSDALGRRRVILTGLVVYALASVGCALATDLTMLLAFRVLQGLSAGVGLIVGRAVIRDVLHGDDAQRLMSQVSMIFGIAPAIAPIIGGWLLGWGRWPMIFWFLVAFALLLIATTSLWLPETHPKPARLPLRPGPLLRGYLAIFVNPRFQRLAAAGAFNFAALFLYIASAPAFVLDLLKLNERQFAWFFVPMIGGMMLGAFLSGRAAGRMSGARLAGIGFACCGAAVTANILYSAFAPQPSIPWAVLPVMLNSFGVALVFPILTLAILDMYPRQRGSASSLQAFTGLTMNALVAGVLSPLLSDHALHLALGAGVFALLGWLCWRWEMTRKGHPAPDVPDEPAALEPTERL
ncbi:multidrug effflux MFS transporter [Luteimonas aquatica]|uniref:multidrug effflux MFS transporter n=1 Tax=Luteimonas aquatica TaxID=450364 RepID=UPI001F564B03|nr:multidrug effflux MFS transporter [Luteimonas aquatica]